jgi:hypothetical protein
MQINARGGDAGGDVRRSGKDSPDALKSRFSGGHCQHV